LAKGYKNIAPFMSQPFFQRMYVNSQKDANKQTFSMNAPTWVLPGKPASVS